MKLKPQPPRPRRSAAAKRRATPRFGLRRGGGRGRGSGQARRPGVPMRSRVARRLPSLRRVLAGLGAVAGTGLLVALLNGPWLVVSRVAWAGERITPAGELEEAMAAQRGKSLLAVDTRAVRERLERIPSVAQAAVSASLTGEVTASIVEREAAFVWQTRTARFLGAADGTIFAGARGETDLDAGLETLPHISDERFAARLITVGDVIPDALLRIAMRVADLDPAALGSDADHLAIRLDDEYGFRLVSEEHAWEVALGVYGLDPAETAAAADARLERQVTAVRTLFASHPETEIGWVDVRNPGKVYFRAKG
jgi:cell division septal protein FtsQ